MNRSEEQQRLRHHLSHVEHVLRERAVDHLPAAERARRRAHLDRLGDYWRSGRFPRNHDAPVRTPVFIDQHGGRCAVAELLCCDGREALALRIAATMKNAYLRDMADDELGAWVRGSGLTLDELAWIQPAYSPEWALCDQPCAEICAEQAPEHYEWDGAALRPVGRAAGAPLPDRVWRAEDGTLWGIGPSGLSRQGKEGWEPVAPLPKGADRGAWPTKDGSLLAYGREVVRMSKGERGFREEPIAGSTVPDAGPAPQWSGAWGAGDEAWFVGGTIALHLARGEVTRVAFPPILDAARGTIEEPMYTVRGTGARDVWFAGSGTGPMHWDGSQLATFEPVDPFGNVAHATTQLAAIWTQSPGEAWFGGNDTLGRWKDGVWTGYLMDGGQRGAFVYDIAGSGPSDLWAVGARNAHRMYPGGTRGLALHWDGKRWRSFDVGAEIRFVYQPAPGKVWLVASAAGCSRYTRDERCLAEKREACRKIGQLHKLEGPEEKLQPSDPTPLDPAPRPLVPVITTITPVEKAARATPASDAAREPEEDERRPTTPAIAWIAGGASGALLLGLLAWLRRRRS
jgi:hypothetical protein